MTTVRLPDPHRSRAVLIGASQYEERELTGIAAISNNLTDLAAVLTDPDRGGLRPEVCTVIADPKSPQDLGVALTDLAQEAEDVLIVYYAGHGLIAQPGSLYLAVERSSLRYVEDTAFGFDRMRRIIHGSRAKTRILILDCCFAGRAVAAMGDASAVLGGLVEIEGTYTMASSPANAPSIAPPGARNTAFSGTLISILRDGVPGGSELVALREVFGELRHRQQAAGHPEPQQKNSGLAQNLALCRNAAARHRPRTSSPLDATLDGVNALARHIVPALGPGGTQHLIPIEGGGFWQESDPRVVAARFQPAEPAQAVGCALIRDLIGNVAERSGDGITTAVALAQAFIRGAHARLADGADLDVVLRTFDYCAIAAVQGLDHFAVPVETMEQVLQVTVLAADGDRQIAEILSNGMDRTGLFGKVVLEQGPSPGLELDVVNGTSFDAGLVDPELFTDDDRSEAVLENPRVLLVDGTLLDAEPVRRFLLDLGSRRDAVLVVARDVADDLVRFMAIEKLRGRIQVAAVRLNDAARVSADEVLRDLAAISGGGVLRPEELGELSAETWFGQARKAIVTRSTTILAALPAQADGVTARYWALQEELDHSASDRVFETVRRLEAGIAIVKIGPGPDRQARMRRAGNGLRVARQALDYGLVRGGANVLAGLGRTLSEPTPAEQHDRILMQLYADALAQPLRQLAHSSGLEAGSLVDQLSSRGPDIGLDVERNAFYDLRSGDLVVPPRDQVSFQKGPSQLIVDSFWVVRTALIAANSTALRFLTSASGLPGATDEGR
ncbi:caspase family protein [Actinospica durhamensis]|uniref:60 kDa chaperonin n=1 Tax=Actinospica durhamensis TaxID=1508375 RepID=A0A941EL33_9ACTN|nr:TCP-1/cpn60 chaperonin family protein [Actinospica durhamensis]MBR7833136.1 caspase family protein [Actinospica durhamensis]